MNAIFLIGGLVLLCVGGEALIRGAVALGNRLRLPPMLVGIVIVGFGTSLPELFVSVQATVSGAPHLAVGNVIGSNISNILFILAVAALIRPFKRPDRALMPDGIVLVAISIAVILLGLQGEIPAMQGVVFVVLLVSLLSAEYVRARRQEQLQRIYEEPVPLAEQIPQKVPLSLTLIVVGVAGLVFGADLLVAGTTNIARTFGVSEALIGLTIVAIGTSLPELAGSAVASWRGHSSVAYGNVIGSNLFNLLGILGVSAMAGPLSFPQTMVWLDGTVMIAATVLMLYFVSSGTRLDRWEAVIMLGCYLAYLGLRVAYSLS
ncbi:MAG: calcium/sodium antiporter [Pseudomonadota bacterium]